MSQDKLARFSCYAEICKCVSREELLIYLQERATIEILEEFNKYGPDDFHDYNREQIIWLKQCRYYLGEKLNHSPTELEFIKDYEDRNLSLIFRAFYCITHSNSIHLL